MKTKKQEELINSFLVELDDELAAVYREIILYLSELGYNPYKAKNAISFKCDLHNKQIAKMGMRSGKNYTPFFSLRFSACRDYPQRFKDAEAAYIQKSANHIAMCPEGKCFFCAGEPQAHTYTRVLPTGELEFYCGAYAVEIPNITPQDIAGIKNLIQEEHAYLVENEGGRGA